MNKEERISLITRNTEEVIGRERLTDILKKKKPITYCGYECSGEIHLGHLVTITKLLDLQKAGIHIKILFADWHTWLNRKGDWNFIRKTTKIWEKGFKASGLTKAEFILGSSFQMKKEYINDIFQMSLKTTISRALRSMQQVARDIEHAKVSQVIYPFMQIADIKHLSVDIVEAGMEQRKIHMLGHELFPTINYTTPIYLHTPLISSLKGPGKMSSTDPSSMISIRDTEKEIQSKINKAYCPEAQINENPILQIMQLIIFPRYEQINIKRPSKFGGSTTFNSYQELENAYKTKKLHPADLKSSVAEYLTKILSPIRKAFQ
ncbi:MAG: tyrosine--tRNA ligase [Nanoarchaeota archaeon]|nr:tyrosine--tRNA ligase [Nanoarchaeota archaeon]